MKNVAEVVKQHHSSNEEKIVHYYQEAGPDYATWSPRFNMHFGYCRRGMNPFKLEAMLEQMTLQAVQRLGLPENAHVTLVDLGCGLGAPLRTLAQRYPHWNLVGVTLVPWQVHRAGELNSQSEKYQEIRIIRSDYCQTPLDSASVDAVLMMESACYAEGPGKDELIREVYRLLKPGGRFVICDGFIKHPRPLKPWIQRIYQALCDSWALDELPNITNVYASLVMQGLRSIKLEDISWKVAPSVSHVPFKVLKFLWKQVVFGKRPMNKARWDNLRSPLLTMILGLARKDFGYYIISGVKPGDLS